MALDGVVLKLDTGPASEAQKKFEAATTSTFDVLQKQSDALQALQKKLTEVATSTKSATEATAKTSEANKQTVDSIKQLADVSGKAAEGGKKLGTSSKAAGDETKKLGAKVGDTVGFLQKLFSVAGQSGASKGIGLLAGGFKALVTSLNPVGLVVGLAAGALISVATSALKAQTDLGALNDRARTARENFSLLTTAVDKAGSSLDSFAQKRAGTQGFTGTTTEAITSLQSLIAAGKQAVADLNTEVAVNKDSFLDVDRIKALGQALGLTTSELKELDKAAKETRSEGKVSDSTLANLRESGLPFSTQRGGRGDRELILETSKAAEAARVSLLKYERQLQSLKDELYTDTKPFEALGAAIIEQTKNDKLGSKELETKLKLEELRSTRAQGFTDAQQNLADAALRQARAYDQAKIAAKDLAESESKLAKAQHEKERADREAAAAADRLLQQSERRSESLRKIREQTELLLITDEKSARARSREIETGDLLDATGTDKNSADAAKFRSETAGALKARDAAEEWRAKLEEVKSVGAEVGSSIGSSLLQAAQSGQNLRGALRGVAESLAQIASQKLVVDLLARLGSSLAGSFFGNFSNTTGVGGTNPNQQPLRNPGGNARGGYLPTGQGPIGAARGIVLDQYQTFSYNGRNITTNEGGNATPEAIMPLARDQYGRLGVQTSGQSPSYVVNIPGVKSADEARRIRPTVVQMLQSIERGSARKRSGLRAGR